MHQFLIFLLSKENLKKFARFTSKFKHGFLTSFQDFYRVIFISKTIIFYWASIKSFMGQFLSFFYALVYNLSNFYMFKCFYVWKNENFHVFIYKNIKILTVPNLPFWVLLYLIFLFLMVFLYELRILRCVVFYFWNLICLLVYFSFYFIFSFSCHHLPVASLILWMRDIPTLIIMLTEMNKNACIGAGAFHESTLI